MNFLEIYTTSNTMISYSYTFAKGYSQGLVAKILIVLLLYSGTSLKGHSK